MLKRSGYVENLRNGVSLAYIASYSADVEYGKEAKPVEGTFTYHIPEHRRRNSNGSISIVKAHDVTYVNRKVIRFRPKYSKFERGAPITRVISVEAATKGQRFLGRALDQEIQKMPEDIEFYLKQLETR